MLNVLKGIFRARRDSSAAELAYRQRLRDRYSRLVLPGAKATPTELPDMIGYIVGHICWEALATRETLHNSLSSLDRTSLALRLTYACFAVSRRAGVKLDASMVATALVVIHPAYIATFKTADLIYRCTKQVPKWRLGSRQPEPTAEETMVLRYLDREETLVLQTLGKQLEREVHAARATRAIRLRSAAA